MILGIVSDTHGFYEAWLTAYDNYLKHADLIIHVGDILYCSPGFNPLTQDFNPGKLADHINSIKTPIIFCKGDNDSDVDQKKLRYPIMSEHVFTYIDGLKIMLHHGESDSLNFAYRNRLTPKQMYAYAAAMQADIYIMGRTHKPEVDVSQLPVMINPGSPVPTVHDNDNPSIAMLDTQTLEVKIMSTTHINKIIKSVKLPLNKS